MLRLSIFTCFFICFHAYAIDPTLRLNGRIVGGTPADISEAPYQVAALLDWGGTGVFLQACGGSIISENAIVTAAHCIENTRVYQWQIRAGSTFSTSGGQVKSISRMVMHPSFGNRFDFDIAIMFLSSPLTIDDRQTAIIPLPAQGVAVQDNSTALVTGWGAEEEGGIAINLLQKLTVPIVNQDVCANAYLGINPVTERMICAGNLEGGQDACQGDSGGPLAIDGVLIGITSWGRGCARPGFPGVFTRVPALRAWIDSVI